MPNAPAGPRRLGTLHSTGASGTVRLEDQFLVDVHDLWSALTDPARLTAWLGVIEGDLSRGGTFHAAFLASGWEGTCRIVLCDPPRRLVIETESEDQLAGRFDISLASNDRGASLILEDQGVSLDQIAAYGAGDQIHFEDLAAYLAGGERCDARSRWQELHPAYRAAPVEPA